MALARLVCLPPGGASAAFYRQWVGLLPPEVELVAVQYPGRLDRAEEPCVDDMARMAGHVSGAIASLLDRPIALFGHSLGGSVAFEVARRIEQRYGARLAWVVVSGRPAPDRARPGTRHLCDDQLWADLRRLGGAPDAALDHPELRAMAIRALRGDYRLIETYRPRPGPPLASPLAAWLGDDDPEVTEEQARVWGRFGGSDFEVRAFPGGHFYLVAQREAVVAEVVRGLLDRVSGQPAGGPPG